MTDRERLLALNRVSEAGSLKIRRLLDAFGGIEGVFAASEAKLRQVEGIGPILGKRIAQACRNPVWPADELQTAHAAGCRVITWLDDGYPEPLKTIPDPPLVLYMKGTWMPEDRAAVAIVGARHATLYGQQTAQRLAYELAIRGVTVVSGLARGIDASVHQGALKALGRTIGVIGNGLSQVYPPEHEALYEQVAAHGVIMSEYPMGMDPLPHHFPQRNRLISGLSLGVVVVEAAHKSGALITADCALEQGREVFAIPGKIDSPASQGTHHLLKQGAKLATCVEDILEELQLELNRSVPRDATPATPPAGDSDERRLLACLSADQPSDVDALAIKAGVPVASCATTLLRLELKHLVRQLPGKQFILQQTP